MAKKKLVHIECKSVGPGILNALPGPNYMAVATWSDGSRTTGYGNSKSEAERNAIRKGGG